MNKRHPRPLTSFFALAALADSQACAPARADGGSIRFEEIFEMVDTGNDGVVSK